MKLVYLDKKDRVRAWLGSRRSLLVAAAVLVFLLLPVWRESTSGPFLLSLVHPAVVRTVVPGAVEDIFVKEGTPVSAGEPLARLRNLPLQSDVANAQFRYVVAADRAISATTQYKNYGAALKERETLAAQFEQLRLKAANLQITSPISGVILTPRLQDRIGSYLTEGTELLEVADLNSFQARIYVSEYDMHKVREGAQAKLQVEGVAEIWRSRATAIAPVSRESDPALLDQTKFKGLHPPQFYLVELLLSDGHGRLKPGMRGVARIYGKRMSLAGLILDDLRMVLARKIW